MNEIKRITIIGAGCVGDFLATRLYERGFEIVEVVSRRKKSAVEIAKKVKAKANQEDFEKMNKDSDLYILCVKDEVIMELRNKIQVGDKLIVHTSGSMTIDVFKKASTNYGLIYPLQTIIRERKINLDIIPFFVDGNTEESCLRIENFVKSFTNNVFRIEEAKRVKLHMAAIFASNFTNYMYKIAQDIMNREQIPMEVLKPLAYETIDKIFELGPIASQTGPARRGDCVIIDKHKSLLKNQQRKLYSMLSNMIKKDFRRVRQRS